jgi:hypothetical protein
MGFYSVFEGGDEIEMLASLSGAAMLWNENRARRVFEMAPSGPLGPHAWQQSREMTVDELLGALPVGI